MTEVEQVTDALAYHGEGPVWDAGTQTLHWVDMLAGDVLSLGGGPGSPVERRHVGEVAAALRPRRGGGMVVGIERGFALAEPGWSEVRPLPPIWSDTGIRMNEGGCDPQGRFYCGSMAYDGTPGAGALYRLDPGGEVSRVLEGVTTSNGLAWSPDGGTAYYIDTATQRVDRFEFDGDTAAFTGRRPAVTIDAAAGGPDGLAVDAEGGLWVALWDGGAVRRYTPDGKLDAVIELPTPRVTACTFGGPDLTDLYITTSRVDLPPDQRAGALFTTVPGVQGQPTLPFAG